MSLPAAITERGAAIVPDHIIARVSGTDPVGFLDDTTTQALRDLAPGDGALTCYLDERGRLLAELRVLVLTDGGVLIDAEPAAREGLERLARIAGLAACSVELTSWTMTAIRGPDAPGALVLPTIEHTSVERGGAVYVRVRWGGDGVDVLASDPVETDAPPMGIDDLDSLRVAHGRPLFGVDIQPGMLVNETPLFDRAVDLPKGCFPGQESVARVHNLGEVRRRFVGVRLSPPVPQTPCTLVRDGEEVGTLTSAAGDRGIAVVRSTVDIGSTLQLPQGSVTVERAL